MVGGRYTKRRQKQEQKQGPKMAIIPHVQESLRWVPGYLIDASGSASEYAEYGLDYPFLQEHRTCFPLPCIPSSHLSSVFQQLFPVTVQLAFCYSEERCASMHNAATVMDISG